jgi:hypothetical protein
VASVLVQVPTNEDAEHALAELWLQVELNDLATPDLSIKFDGANQITLVVTIDGSASAARMLRAWSRGVWRPLSGQHASEACRSGVVRAEWKRLSETGQP